MLSVSRSCNTLNKIFTPLFVGCRCSWYFHVQQRVGVDIICDEINLPCPYKNFMYIKFNFNKRPSKLCTGNDPDKIYRDQELNVKAYSSKYWDIKCKLILKS